MKKQVVLRLVVVYKDYRVSDRVSDRCEKYAADTCSIKVDLMPQRLFIVYLVKGSLCRNQALAVSSGILGLLCLHGRQLFRAGCDFFPQTPVGSASHFEGLEDSMHVKT